MSNAQSQKETNAARMKRMPKVLIAYAKDIRGDIILDSGADECLVFAAHSIEALLRINTCMRAALESLLNVDNYEERKQIIDGITGQLAE